MYRNRDSDIITKTRNGYELNDSTGAFLALYREWRDVADAMRKEDLSEEYIAQRKRIADSGHAVLTDETIP